MASGGPTAFVLGGGGVLGAAEVGMLRALFEQNIVPDLIVGSSVGALNGAFIAADPSMASVERMVDCGPDSPSGGCSADRSSASSARWPATGRTSTPTTDCGDCSMRGSARLELCRSGGAIRMRGGLDRTGRGHMVLLRVR